MMKNVTHFEHVRFTTVLVCHHSVSEGPKEGRTGDGRSFLKVSKSAEEFTACARSKLAGKKKKACGEVTLLVPVGHYSTDSGDEQRTENREQNTENTVHVLPDP